MEHYVPSIPGKVHWGLWDGTLKPALTIKSGDRMVIEALSTEPEDVPDATLGFSIIHGLKEMHGSNLRGPAAHFLAVGGREKRARHEHEKVSCAVYAKFLVVHVAAKACA
jgi:hypothetical protein